MAPDLNNESKLFIEFIQSFDKYLQPLSEISKNHIGPIVTVDKEMYNFDEMCQNTKSFSKIENYSRTTDAFYYKIKENGELKLYFIEFKGDYLQNFTREKDMETFSRLFKKCKKELPSEEQISNYGELFNEHQTRIYGNFFSDRQCNKIKQINNKFSDSLIESLELKPLESILVALPVIYKDYVEEHNTEKINIKKFLENCEKEIWVIALSTSNRTRGRVQRRRPGSYYEKIETQYDRLKMADVFDNYAIEDRYSCIIRLNREFDLN